ncbi:MAG: bifunctional phosphoribosylaminoimidazolecarboxamide formyltransferase/IMP cyclohydrolase [Neisseriaceae bacterium]
MATTIKRALISVSDKTDILNFARQLRELDIEIISTGGTFRYLTENGIDVTEVADITKFPEILDGRVKTLHPLIHGGILARRDKEIHLTQMKEHNINSIDLVCVNLYPFEATINKKDVTFNEAIENIDIGGPAMVRASAKNHQHVVIVTNPKDYKIVLDELSSNEDVTIQTRLKLAQKAFSHTSYYDSLISQYLDKQLHQEALFKEELTIPAKLVQTLRYGENSHQMAAFYRNSGNIDGLLSSFKQLQGKELSYNNLVDADTAWECVKQFQNPACVIVKHANPCGVAVDRDAISSYLKAFSSDPVSSFGGIIALNSKLDGGITQEITKQFVEVLIAPDFDAEALTILATKPNIRVLQIDLTHNTNVVEYKSIGGGLLLQTPEDKKLSIKELSLVSKKAPSNDEYEDLLFAWNVARFVKSNAIVLVKDKQTIGIGAGQMSRIDSTKIAVSKAKEFGFEVSGAVCASDAFFPFRDNVDLLASYGVSAIIHPGGSIKDKEVFAASDELNIAMVLTNYRVFRH